MQNTIEERSKLYSVPKRRAPDFGCRISMLVYVVVLFRLLEKRGENCHLGALSYQVFLATLKKEEKTNKLVLNVSKTEK